jgi:energy-coupling factor transporter ATP-binding protein EcfA2
VSDRLHVGFASSNIKGGVSTPLGYRTLVVGPNGSGKSAIQNTVELVLTGRVSDVAGRSDVGDAGLIERDHVHIAFDHDDAARLADAISLLARNSALRTEMGSAARSFVETRFSAVAIGAASLTLYRSLTQRPIEVAPRLI